MNIKEKIKELVTMRQEAIERAKELNKRIDSHDIGDGYKKYLKQAFKNSMREYKVLKCHIEHLRDIKEHESENEGIVEKIQNEIPIQGNAKILITIEVIK